MIERTNLEQAHALLAPQFQTGSVSDWQLGRDLPLSFAKTSRLGSVTVAYSGPLEVGLVVSIDKPGDPDGGLVALRFVKRKGWLIDYVHQGHASPQINATNYSPAGFLPGSHRETTWTWLILALGLAGLITIVGVADWFMSRTRPLAG